MADVMLCACTVTDISPVVLPGAWTPITREFVYLDFETKPENLHTLLSKLATASFARAVVVQVDPNYTRIDLSDGRAIHFFSGIEHPTMTLNPHLAPLLEKVSSLLMNDTSFCDKVYAALPHLRTIYVSENGHGAVPPEHRSKMEHFVDCMYLNMREHFPYCASGPWQWYQRECLECKESESQTMGSHDA